MEEWKEYKLGDVCSRLRSGKGIKADSVFNSGKYPVIGGNGVRGYADVPNFEGQAAIIGRQGAYCGNVRFFEGEAYMTEHAIVAVGNELADTRFLASLLSLMHLGNLSAQSAQPGISVQTLSKQPIRLPSISYQKKVSAIIKSLDDKIEVNRLINDNLEQQAQALFKSWFVDFEPFRDQPFVESELGMIPEGWRVGRLSDIASINPQRPIKKGDTATYLDMKNMPTSGPFPLLCEIKEYTGGMRFQNQDTLMARITPCLENGKVAYVNFLEEKEIAFGSTEYIVMTTIEGLLPELLYFLCRDEEFKGYATKNMNGSSGRQRVSGETIGNYKMVLPPKSVLEAIASYFKSVMNTIKNNGFESRRLAELRDTLLPRLMSGEIKVGDVTL